MGSLPIDGQGSINLVPSLAGGSLRPGDAAPMADAASCHYSSAAFSMADNLRIHQPVAHLLYCPRRTAEVHFLWRSKADETGKQPRESPGGKQVVLLRTFPRHLDARSHAHRKHQP